MRCRSAAVVVALRSGEVAVQLEQWAGRETVVSVLREDGPPILLHAAAVAGLMRAVGALAEQAGWATALRG